jgi:hypothetical protein
VSPVQGAAYFTGRVLGADGGFTDGIPFDPGEA